MKVESLILKRSTYVYVASIVYVCAFFFFLNQGMWSECYEANGLSLESNMSFSLLKDDLSDFSLKNIFLTNEIYIIKNYLGIISFGIYPIVMLIYNGGFFGMFVSATIPNTGTTFVVLHTLPHSFELVPVILSSADSLFLGVHLACRMFGFHRGEVCYLNYIKNFLLYTIIIAIAAFFESYISL